MSARAIVEASETAARDIKAAGQAAVYVAAEIMKEAEQLATELRGNGEKISEHLREFATAWEGMRKKLVDSLSTEEQQAFNALGSEHQREGFLIVRAFAGAAAYKGKVDFAIARASAPPRSTSA